MQLCLIEKAQLERNGIRASNSKVVGMKKLVLATMLAAAFATSAHAADAIVSTEPVVVEPVGFEWTGFYVGLNGGYLWGNSRLFEGFETTDSFSMDGFVGGAQAGYNFQTGAWVFGVETDIQYSDASGTTNVNCFACTSEIDWFGTLRARGGYAFDNALIYATGGLAYGGVTATAPGSPFNISETETGWTAGAGFEYAFTPNWTAKAEYLYMDLDTADGLEFSADYDDNNIFRVGFNYLFK